MWADGSQCFLKMRSSGMYLCFSVIFFSSGKSCLHLSFYYKTHILGRIVSVYSPAKLGESARDAYLPCL